MSVSSYARLLERFGNWDFWPYAGVYYIDLHDLRGLNRVA